jgi:capsular polysaccharide biosynthesis protein
LQIKDYVGVVRKRWYLFLVCIVIFSSAAFIFSRFQTPMYRSTAKLYVMPSRSDLGLTLTAQNLVRQYSQLLASDRFLNEIDRRLQLDTPPPLLRSRINAAGTADNLAIEIQADWPNPEDATRIAGALAREFMSDQERRMAARDSADRIEVLMYDDATPAVLNRPQTRTNVIAGGLLGLLIAVIIAFVLEYLDDTIKDPDDVDRYVDLPVVGNIPTITA